MSDAIAVSILIRNAMGYFWRAKCPFCSSINIRRARYLGEDLLEYLSSRECRTYQRRYVRRELENREGLSLGQSNLPAPGMIRDLERWKGTLARLEAAPGPVDFGRAICPLIYLGHDDKERRLYLADSDAARAVIVLVQYEELILKAYDLCPEEGWAIDIINSAILDGNTGEATSCGPKKAYKPESWAWAPEANQKQEGKVSKMDAKEERGSSHFRYSRIPYQKRCRQ